MNKKTISICCLGVGTTILGVLLLIWGCSSKRDVPESESPTFTMESPAPYPVLNAITDNPITTFSDERDSLKIMEYGASGDNREAFGHYQTEMTLEAGKQYSLLLHVHNDADGELDMEGVAKNVQFTVSCPTIVNGDGSISVLLSADNTTPMITGSSVSVHTDGAVRLSFTNGDDTLYPVKRYNYALQDETKLAVGAVVDDIATTITGNVGDLLPGNTTESGAYVYLWFSVEADTQ